MPWDLALPLLIVAATVLLFAGIFWSARKLLIEPRRTEDTDQDSQSAGH